jgi:hypothetical protein
VFTVTLPLLSDAEVEAARQLRADLREARDAREERAMGAGNEIGE